MISNKSITADISKKINSIDIMRYVCAIMVVAIHTHPLEDISDNIGYITTEIIPRIGVPFFLAVSGYFYIQKLEKGSKTFFKYIKRIITIYLVWSCPYFLLDFIQWGHSSITGYTVNCIYSFFYTGSHYHFWFFPALIYSVIITTIIWKLKCQKLLIPVSLFLYVIGCLGCSYYKFGIHIPILSNLYLSEQFVNIRRIFMMGFPFFTSGYVVHKISSVLQNKKAQYLVIAWCIVLIIWIAELVMVIKLKWQDNIVITFGLYLLLVATLLLLIRNPIPQFGSLAAKCKTAANFTYYAHPLVILLISYLSEKIFNTAFTQTPTFILTVIITGITAMIIYKLDNKILNWLVRG